MRIRCKALKIFTLLLIAALLASACACNLFYGKATVVFDTAGGEYMDDLVVKAGAPIPDFDQIVPVRAYATFDGWYHEGIKWTAGTVVTGDVTLTARWTPHETPGLVMTATDGGWQVSAFTGTDTDVVIPYSHSGQPVVRLCEGAFAAHTNLTSIVIPDSVTEIGSEFLQFTSLKSVTYPARLISDVAKCAATLKEVIITSGTEIPVGAFTGCGVLNTVTIPDSITKIGAAAFSGCFCLTSIYIPAGVTEIGIAAFSDCMKLVEVKNDSAFDVAPLTSGVGNLGASALSVYSSFRGQSRLFFVDEYAFVDTDEGTYLCAYHGEDDALVLPTIGKPYKINHRAFFNVGGSSVTMPEGVTEIGYEAFYGCGNILHFDFPASLEYIAYSAIFNCAFVQSATYAGTVAQWNAIEKNNQWNLHAYSFPIVCDDGTTYSR